MIFNKMILDDYEQVVFCNDKESGLKAIIVIHDTTLGPALGGCRMWPYESEEEALEDALRLAKGMTYKNSAAGLNLGGGKAVIIGDPKKDKSEFLFRAFGRYVESLNGRYITAEDVGITPNDLAIINLETSHTVGLPESYGSSGDPAPVTAIGIYSAMKRTAKEAFGSDSLKGKTISIQGTGNVAYNLCKLLYEDDVKIFATDIDENALNRVVEDFDATPVGIDDIYDVEADIFAPCALGAILNDETIPKLKVKAICGSANNQLEDITKHSSMLEDRNIVYAPDYIVNSGGAINVSDEIAGYNKDRAILKAKKIYNQLDIVFKISKEQNISSALAADKMAEERIKNLSHIKNIHIK